MMCSFLKGTMYHKIERIKQMKLTWISSVWTYLLAEAGSRHGCLLIPWNIQIRQSAVNYQSEDNIKSLATTRETFAHKKIVVVLLFWVKGTMKSST